MGHSYSISELCSMIGGVLRGDGSGKITGAADIREAGPNEAAWVSRDSFVEAAKTSRAGVVLVPKDFPPTPMPAILCEKIEPAIARLLQAFAKPASRPAPGIHPTAIIDPTATVGDSPSIGPYVVVEAGVKIGVRAKIYAGAFVGRDCLLGDDCQVWPNAVIMSGCVLGSRVTIHPGAVIGRPGFGFYFDGQNHIPVPHDAGGVILEDDVEIGACSCVDRAKVGNTVIARGTKIDNLVQVAHNCRIGKHNILAGQTGISGSVRSGDYCIFGARVGVFDNIAIGNNVRIGGISVLTKDLPDNMQAGGFPAQDLRTELREKAAVRRLPALYERIKELTERIERLENSHTMVPGVEYHQPCETSNRCSGKA